MGVVSVYSFRTLPGGYARHVEAAEEARQRLQGLGVAAFTLTPLAGSFTGEIATVLNHADNASWAADMAKVQADEGWQEFYLRVMAEGFAEQTEASIYVDLDPTFVPAADRPLGAMVATQWRPMPGRAGDLLAHIEQAHPHIERLGGGFRAMNCMQGAEPMTMTVSITFEDLEHLAEYNDKLAVDEQFATYWAGIMANPSAALVRSGTFLITV